jgi:putative hydrolases of HD superfamily
MNPIDRLNRQIDFLIETEKLKAVLRRNLPINATRCENTAEHSWTLALMAIVLVEHANQDLDLLRVLQMLIIHDLVEIDAGDTFCYAAAANATKADREIRAAGRIFGLLPEPQATGFRELWQEFEAQASAEAVFANALDRLMPLLQNVHNEGGSWREFGITSQQALDRSRPIANGSAALGNYAQALLTKAEQLNFFSKPKGDA